MAIEIAQSLCLVIDFCKSPDDNQASFFCYYTFLFFVLYRKYWINTNKRELSNNECQVMHRCPRRDKGCERSLPCPCAGGWCGWRPMGVTALHPPARREARNRAPLHSPCQGQDTSRHCRGGDQKIPAMHCGAAISNPCDGRAGKGLVKGVPQCQCRSPGFRKGRLPQKQDFSNLLLLCLYLLIERYRATPYLIRGDIQI